MVRFSLNQQPQTSREPFSLETLGKASRLRGATVTEAVCPYCAVGCGQLIYAKAGQIIDIEGNPESPINEGTLCPKGANAFQRHGIAGRAAAEPEARKRLHAAERKADAGDPAAVRPLRGGRPPGVVQD